MSAGQHLHLSGDLKGNVSIAAQQGMHFSQHNSQNGTSQAQTSQNNSQHSQHSPLSNSQHQNSPMQNNMNAQHGQNTMNHQSGPQVGNAMVSGHTMPGSQLSSQQSPLGANIPGGIPGSGGMPGPGSLGGANNMGMPNNSMGQNNLGPNSAMGGPGSNIGGPGSMPNNLGGMQHPGMHVGGLTANHGDSYSMSQTQTINFTQQSLRRAGGTGGKFENSICSKQWK